ncbi:MAG: response regulator [Bdellovibrio sp.]|nr:response regulator [Bdellovibrio sp.]
MFDAKTKVLVVDDMRTMRKMVKQNLQQLGFVTIEEAEDGQIAMNKLRELSDIGLVISDWNMPNCTGLDFLKSVRADEKFKSLPFILLTAEGEVEQVKEALAAGVDSYILKPFTPKALKEKIEQTYKKRFS